VEVLNPLEARRFTEKDSLLAQVFANLAAIAVANSKLFRRYERDNRGLKQQLAADDEMIGTSEAMEQVADLIRRVGPTNATVLLTGETGTGKELAARLVHECSDRSERSFIAVNCAALPHTLLESELFGHEAGAFTGATGRKLGRFELADGGTIFLDEVSEIATDVQVKLLRVLQEKEIVRVGGTRPIGCDVRVIAATNRDLDEEMRDGRFRKDLYFRLNVFPIEIPPLRQRREDIPLLIEHFLKRIAGELKIPEPVISEKSVAVLVRHEFPGNVRELQNVLERACLLCYAPGDPLTGHPRIEPQHLPREFLLRGEESGEDEGGGSVLAAGEKAMIVNALRASNWNQAKAARALGITRDNIRYRIKKYGIKKPD
jgi:two-component system NtrC family response regulator